MIGTVVAAILVGLFIGIFSGLLGIGGGTIMVPIFRLGFGMSAIASTATSLFTIIPTSISGAVSHLRNGTCILKLGLAVGIGGALTSPLGVAAAQIAPGWLVMLAAAAVIVYSSITMFRKALAAPRANARRTATSPAPSQASEATPAAPVTENYSSKQLFTCVGIGLIAGFISGFVGVGGGFIIVPLLVSLLNLPMTKTSGTSLIAVMILATPATIEQCILGNVDYFVGLAVACGSIPGAMLGARLIKVIPERTLRFMFGGFLVIAAILLLVKESGLLG